MTRLLADVAMGRQPPDYIITRARIFSTYSDRIFEEREVWIKGGRIAAIKRMGSYLLLPGDRTVRYDAAGGILAPGLVDAHVHLSSSMMSACTYAEAALCNGTTTIICDCEEIAALCEGRGFRWFIADIHRSPFSVYLKVPAAMLGLRGKKAEPAEVAKLFQDWPEAVALSERANFAGVLSEELGRHAMLAEALKGGHRVSGCVQERDSVAVNAVVGMTDVHDAADLDLAEECLEAGQWLLLRGDQPGSATGGQASILRLMTELGASAKRVCLCTGARDVRDLFRFGLDWVVRQAVAAGVSPVMAWSMASLHPASRYGLDGEIGGIGPGRRADLVLLNDDLEVQNTWYGGELVVENKKITAILDKALSKRYHYPKEASCTIKLPRPLSLLPVLPQRAVTANIIGVGASGGGWEHRKLALRPVKDWDALLAEHQLNFVVVVGLGGAGVAGYGLLQGFGLANGAVASSVSEETPRVIVAGNNESEMKFALATLKEQNGGMSLVRGGQVLARMPLPIGGLLSDQRGPDVALQWEAFKRVWARLGCTLSLLDFCRIAQGAVSEIRLTPDGLVLGPEACSVPLFEPEFEPDGAATRSP